MIIDKALNQSKTLLVIFTVTLIAFLVSVATNLFLVCIVTYLQHKETTVVIPFDHEYKYKVSNDNYNSQYLNDMGLSFVSLRLNNSPETVHKKHELLLSYVDERSRPEISAVLADEEKVITDDDLTSAFFYEEINLYPEKDVFEIIGTLKTWSGSRPLLDQKKKYQLKVKYKNGRFSILNFIEVKEQEEKN